MYATTSCAMNFSKSPCRDRTRIHGTVVYRLRIGQHHDHLLRTEREGAFYRLRHVDLVRSLLGPDGVSMEGIYDRVAAGTICCIARRQEYQHVAINGIALQVVFQRFAVYFDVLHSHRLRTVYHRGHYGLDLRE